MRARHRILCCREFQVSIKDSVHKLLSDRITALGLEWFYRVTQNSIIGENGTEFIFAGLKHNIQSIKSAEGITIAWCEEAQCVSEASWQILIPTIRSDSSEIWLTWNPDQETDPTWQRFVVNAPPGCWAATVNWEKNQWLSEALRIEKDYLYRIDPDAAAHVWGGELRKISDAQVLRGRYVVEPFEPAEDWAGAYFGLDFGYSSDPTALVKLWIHERVLYVEHEAWAIGCDLDDLPALLSKVPGSKDHLIRADSSRPETISHLHRHGFPRVRGAEKGKGSVEDGVEHLRSYERIVIHPRCSHAAEEARLWSYKTDKLSGDVLPVLLDRHDHIWDAARYALEPIIRAGKPRKKEPPKPVKRPDYDGPRMVSSGAWKTR